MSLAQVITGQNKIYTPEGTVLDPNRPITLTDFVKNPPTSQGQLNKGGFQGDLGKVGDKPTSFKPSKVTPVKVNNSAYVIVGGKAIRKENLGINVTSSFDQLPKETNPILAKEHEFTKNLAENLAKEKLQSQIVEGKTVKESQSIVDKYGVKKTDRNILNTYFQKDQIGTIDSIPIQTEGGSDIAPRRTALLLENALITGQKNVDITFNPLDDIQPNVTQIEEQIRGSQKENLGLEPLVNLTPTGGSANLSEDQFNELQKQISDLVKQGTPQDFITDPNDPRLNPQTETLDIFKNPIILIILAVIGVGVISAVVLRKKK